VRKPPTSPFSSLSLAALALTCGVLLACKGPPSGEVPPGGVRTAEEVESEEQATPPLTRAKNLFAGGDLTGARAAIEEVLREDEDHAQARYLHARVLTGMGEYRGARADLLRVVEGQPRNALALDLLASLEEQLGDYQAALARYRQVNSSLRAEEAERAAELSQQGLPSPKGVTSVAPLIGMARCHLVLGEADQALRVLDQAKAAANADPAVDYWRFVVLDRLEQSRAAEGAARNFLRLTAGQSGALAQHREIRRWLSKNSQTLPQPIRAVMVDYLRAAIRLRLPGETTLVEDTVLSKAPARLLVFDDRPVFVTLLPQGGKKRFLGVGRGRSLAGALKGAMTTIQEDSTWTRIAVRDCAIRVEIGRELAPARFAQVDGQLTLTPPLAPGHHGVGLRAGGREVYLLPCDFPHEDLTSLEEGLELACKRAGVHERAWQGAGDAVFRFETEAFFSPRPGAQPQPLVAGEPGPAPDPTLRTLQRSLDRGVRFLNRHLVVELTQAPKAGQKPSKKSKGPQGGEFPQAYLPVQGLVSRARASDVEVGRICQASLALAEEGRARVLLGATQLVLDRALGLSSPRDLAQLEPEAQAALLEALSDAPPELRKRYAGQARALARALRSPPRGAKVEAAAALLAWASATGKPATAGEALVGDLANLDPKEARVRRLLLALIASGGASSEKAAARLLAWAQERIQAREAATPSDLQALARAAQIAEARQHPQRVAFRTWTLEAAGALLALQIDDRHASFCKAPDQAMGGFRDDLVRMRLPLGHSAECLSALRAAYRLVSE
jgi:tetratricopeptide repeat protein